MKTLIIFNDQETLQFGVVEGDYTRFNNVCFNEFQSEHPHLAECLEWLYDDQGNFLIELSEDKSKIENKDWDKVAIITFLQ